MKRVGIVVTLGALAAFVALGVASGQSGQTYDRGWSHMMMGPMAGCPMGAGRQGMMGPHMMGRGGMMGAQGSASIGPQLDSLRSALAVRRDQQDEWEAYAATARADSQSMLDMHNRMVGFMQGQATSAPDWLRVHRDMMRARADSLDALARTVEQLYAALDSSQKATFDQYGGGMCGAW